MGEFVDQSLHLWIASVPDALVLVDARGRIIEANAALAVLFGYEEGELIAQSIETLVPERLRRAHARKRVERALDPYDRPMGGDLVILARRKDGSEFEADIQLCTREMPAGPMTVAVVRDLGAIQWLREVESRLIRIRDRLGAHLEAPSERDLSQGEVREMCEDAQHALEILGRITAEEGSE
jgi:PAS domain S-box-containing protein